MKLPIQTKMLSFVGIDLAMIKTGLVILQVPASDPLSARPKVVSKVIDTSKAQLHGPRLWAYIVSQLQPALDDAAFAAIEGHAMGARGRGKTGLAEVGGVVRMTLFQTLTDDWLEVPPTSVKSFIGSGSSEKHEVIHGVKQWFGFETKSPDIADAFIIAKFAQIAYCIRAGLTPTPQNSAMRDFHVRAVQNALNPIPKPKKTRK